MIHNRKAATRMDRGNVKQSVVFVISIVAVSALAVVFCFNAGVNRKARDKEMALRMDMEEKLSKFSDEKAALATRFSEMSAQLDVVKNSEGTLKQSLVQEQMISQELKEELDKLTRLKQGLEDELRSITAGEKLKK